MCKQKLFSVKSFCKIHVPWPFDEDTYERYSIDDPANNNCIYCLLNKEGAINLPDMGKKIHLTKQGASNAIEAAMVKFKKAFKRLYPDVNVQDLVHDLDCQDAPKEIYCDIEDSDERFPTHSTCIRCKETLPVEYFTKNRNLNTGRSAVCKGCQKAEREKKKQEKRKNITEKGGIILDF
jgi:hypothetical protein